MGRRVVGVAKDRQLVVRVRSRREVFLSALAGVSLHSVGLGQMIRPHPFNIGIEAKDGTFVPLIGGDWVVPSRTSCVFTTVADNQTRVQVHVLQGEHGIAADNKSLAKFELTDIPPAPKGVPQIEVSLEIDVPGIVSVSAQEQTTGRSQSMTIHDSDGLDRAAVERLAIECRTLDKHARERNEVARQLQGLVANTMRSVQALERELTPDERQHILDVVERTLPAFSVGTLEELMARLLEMEGAASIIGQAMLRPVAVPLTKPSSPVGSAGAAVTRRELCLGERPRRASAFKQWVLLNLPLLRYAGIEEEPSLPRDVPRHRERLHPASREADQVLLQGSPSEGVGHLEPVERLPAGSPTGPQQFDAARVPAERHPEASATGPHALAGQPWSAKAVKLYGKLVRARLRKCRCSACGTSLAAALLVRTGTSVGLELNEFGLSDEGAARYLAATDDLVVKCARCGAESVVPAE